MSQGRKGQTGGRWPLIVTTAARAYYSGVTPLPPMKIFSSACAPFLICLLQLSLLAETPEEWTEKHLQEQAKSDLPVSGCAGGARWKGSFYRRLRAWLMWRRKPRLRRRRNSASAR